MESHKGFFRGSNGLIFFWRIFIRSIYPWAPGLVVGIPGPKNATSSWWLECCVPSWTSTFPNLISMENIRILIEGFDITRGMTFFLILIVGESRICCWDKTSDPHSCIRKTERVSLMSLFDCVDIFQSSQLFNFSWFLAFLRAWGGFIKDWFPRCFTKKTATSLAVQTSLSKHCRIGKVIIQSRSFRQCATTLQSNNSS